MFILDILIDIIVGAYVSLGFGTPERKISIKVEKVSKVSPKIMDLYNKHQSTFEKDENLSNLVLKSELKTKDQKLALAKKVYEFFDEKNNHEEDTKNE